MRKPRIYQSQQIQSGQQLALDDEGAAHIGRVLRMQSGEGLIVFNGQGGQYNATIDSANKKNVTVTIDSFEPIDCESPLKLHLGQGVSRGDKMEFTIQKAVELGVSEITPIFTERCGVKLTGERLQKKWQQWQKIAIGACEQSGRNTLPTIHQPISLTQWLLQPNKELKINLHPRATATIKTLSTPENGIRLIIGPEGGLSDDEIEQTLTHGFSEITLGPRVLRTETAGLTVIAALQLQFGDLA
jgi:16S rRNA (uracil1498-N3)-methyltransferase